MRIAVVCPYAFDAHGGVQDQVERLVRWLGEEGHEAWAVAPGSGGPPGTRTVGAWRSVPGNRARAPIAVDPRAVRRVAEAVADADVVHVHEPFMPMVSLGALLAETPPVVATFHADPGKVGRRLYRLARPLMRRVAGRIAVATAVSRVAASAITGVPRVRIIPNGIDLDRFDPEALAIPGRVLFIGRDEPRKGLDVLLQAWPRVLRDVPGATLRVVGSERDSGPVGVTFLGRLGAEEKVIELGRCQVLVAPNLGGESFGLVVLEGLAAGRAVVASALPAFAAVAGDSAVLVPPHDPVVLARAVADLLVDPAAARRLGDRGAARAAAFGRETVLGAYIAAYRDAMTHSG